MLAVTILIHFSRRLHGSSKPKPQEKINGMQWEILTQLDDLDFADDLTLISHIHRQIQDNTTYLARISVQVGLKINNKNKILRLDDTTC